MKVVAKITAQLVSESVVPPKDEFVQMLGHEDSWKRNKN
jgi:hypothetical protein